jgi:hypothetical protein
MTWASDVDCALAELSNLPAIKSTYFQSSSSRTVAPILCGFKKYAGAFTRGAQLESLAYWVNYGHGFGVGIMRLYLDSIPVDSIPSEELPLVRRHLKKAKLLIPEEERVHLRTKYRFDVEEFFLKKTMLFLADT